MIEPMLKESFTTWVHLLGQQHGDWKLKFYKINDFILYKNLIDWLTNYLIWDKWNLQNYL